MTVVALLAAGLLTLQSSAPRLFDIGPGPAASSINRLAAEAGIDVVIATNLRGRRTPALRGRMSAETALDRLLRPVGAHAVRVGEGMYRIEAAPARRSAPPVRPAPAVEVEPTQLSEILVTAVPPVGLTGASGRVLVDPEALLRVEGLAASEAIADLTATVDSTRQGAGRNKLFVRGLADSAMNGPLQATVGQYLGELRLSYGSPDPDLTLIDMRRIEVFEGPQGTRSGIGAIGGVLRIHPQPPVIGETSGRFIAGASLTGGGAPGGDGAVILNRAFGDRTAARLVAYARRDGGFLDNPVLGVREADHIETIGARGTLRWSDETWTVDVTGVAQRVAAGDAQAVAVGQTRFVKTGRVLEPYESSLTLAGLTARRRVGNAWLTSATSVSRQQFNERLDASQPFVAWPSFVDRRQTTRTASSELRLVTDPLAGWTWSGGAAVTVGETRTERRRRDLGPAPDPAYGIDLTRSFAEAAVFGEASTSPAPHWRIALGARLSAVRIDTDIRNVDTAVRAAADRNGASVKLTPSLTARWDASPALVMFGRFEQAVRPAGVGEAAGAFSRYQGDRVTLTEIGARSGAWRNDLSGEISAGWIDWRDVQADIVSPGGDMVTSNVGDGTIRFLSLKAAWRPAANLDVSGSLFINDSRLTPTRFDIIAGGRTDIPNVAPVGAQLSLDYAPGRLAGLPLSLGADLRYVGQSRLGVGPALDVPQGGYLRTELSARLGDERHAATLRISNPFDVRGVRYGIGSPYQLSEPQAVPVRPLTVRLSFESAF